MKRKGHRLAAAARIVATLIWLSANLFSDALSRQSLRQPTLLARLQVVGVTLHFLNDFFRLNFALEPTQGVLQRFALLQSNFCQTHHPQTSPNRTRHDLCHLYYTRKCRSPQIPLFTPPETAKNSLVLVANW